MGRPKFKLVDVSKLQASKSDGSSSKDEPIEDNTGDDEPLLSTQSSVPTEAEEEYHGDSAEIRLRTGTSFRTRSGGVQGPRPGGYPALGIRVPGVCLS